MGDAAEPVPSGGNTTTPNDDMKRVISEYRLMFRYANAAGLSFDEKTQAAVNAVGADPEKVGFADLMTGHEALTKLVVPATPLSLEATEPAAGPMGTLRRPALVLWMIIVAIVAGIGFTWTEIRIQEVPPTTVSSIQSQPLPAGGAIPSASNPATNSAGAATTPPGTALPAGGRSQTSANQSPTEGVSVAMTINWCFAAALGAVFYVLFTVHPYVRDRTFDPRYSTVYLIRFVLGLLSGLIMAALIGQSNFWKLPPERRIWQPEHSRQTVFDAIALGIAFWQNETNSIETREEESETLEE